MSNCWRNTWTTGTFFLGGIVSFLGTRFAFHMQLSVDEAKTAATFILLVSGVVGIAMGLFLAFLAHAVHRNKCAVKRETEG